MPNSSQLEISYWRKNWTRATQIFDHASPVERLRVTRRANLLINLVNSLDGTKKKKVLELGCGTGAYTLEFAKHGWDLTATDLVPEMVKATRKKVSKRKEHKGIKLAVADAKKLQFVDESFDAVIGNSVLHHLIPIEQGLKEIYRVLKPGGVIAFTEPNMLNPHIFFQKNVPYLKKLAGDSPTETAFIRWQLARQLRKKEFTNVRVEPFDFLYPFVPIRLISLIRPISIMLEKMPLVREFAGSVVVSAEKLPKKGRKQVGPGR